MSRKENYFVRSDILNYSSSITSSPLSSRSSSSSSNATNIFQQDEKTAQLVESIVNQFKEEIITEVLNKVTEDYENNQEEITDKSLEMMKNCIKDVYIEKANKLVNLITDVHRKAIKKYTNPELIKKQSNECNDAVKQMIVEKMSGEWQDIATEYIENAVEDVEALLWDEMSSKLHEVYRLYRNTASDLKLSKQTNIDVVENRLESLLLQVHVNNIERIQYLSNVTHQYLEEELKKRVSKMKMEIELKVKTFQRELTQIEQNIEQERETNSTSCIML